MAGSRLCTVIRSWTWICFVGCPYITLPPTLKPRNDSALRRVLGGTLASATMTYPWSCFWLVRCSSYPVFCRVIQAGTMSTCWQGGRRTKLTQIVVLRRPPSLQHTAHHAVDRAILLADHATEGLTCVSGFWTTPTANTCGLSAWCSYGTWSRHTIACTFCGASRTPDCLLSHRMFCSCTHAKDSTMCWASWSLDGDVVLRSPCCSFRTRVVASQSSAGWLLWYSEQRGCLLAHREIDAAGACILVLLDTGRAD